MTAQKIALMFGGQSSEHEPTRKSFAFLLERIKKSGLREDLQLSHVIYLRQDGNAVLSEYDKKRDASYYEEKERSSSILDAFQVIKEKNLYVYGILYGQNGEDGKAAGVMNFFSIPSNLGDVLSGAIGMSKYHLNKYIGGNFSQVKVPLTVSLSSTLFLVQQLSPFQGKEIVIKPSSLGSSVLTEKFMLCEENMSQITELVEKILQLDTRALVQEYIFGTEYSCGVLEKDGDIIVLPTIKIETKGNFFGQQEKFIDGYSKETIIEEKDDTILLQCAKQFAKEVFLDLGFQNAARFDFILTEDGVYFLEINPLPGILRNSLLSRMLRTQGWDVENLVEISFDNERRRRKPATNFYFKVDG